MGIVRMSQPFQSSLVAVTAFPGSPRTAATLGYETQLFQRKKAPGVPLRRIAIADRRIDQGACKRGDVHGLVHAGLELMERLAKRGRARFVVGGNLKSYRHRPQRILQLMQVLRDSQTQFAVAINDVIASG